MINPVKKELGLAFKGAQKNVVESLEVLFYLMVFLSHGMSLYNKEHALGNVLSGDE